MGDEKPLFRTLELTLALQGNTFLGALAPWIPRLVINLRGSTSRMDLAVPDERRAEVRFGAVGVMVGAPRSEKSVAGESSMTWRDVSLAEIEALFAAIDALTSADVDGVPDTGDYFQTVGVSGIVDGEAFGLSVSQMQSGWRGADAVRFVELLNCIFTIAGLPLHDNRWPGLGRYR